METVKIKSEGSRLAVSFRKSDKIMGELKVMEGSAILMYPFSDNFFRW